MAALALGAGLALAQEPPPPPPPTASDESQSPLTSPPEAPGPATVAPAADAIDQTSAKPPPPRPTAKPKPQIIPPPPGPPRPVRGPTAVLQVLDKVTAETLRFEAPVGRRVRYKTLIFTVKVCETRGLEESQPRPSAYVLIESQAGAARRGEAAALKQVFKGWMFANAPGLHALEHPIYDAWLIACSAAAPPA